MGPESLVLRAPSDAPLPPSEPPLDPLQIIGLEHDVVFPALLAVYELFDVAGELERASERVERERRERVRDGRGEERDEVLPAGWNRRKQLQLDGRSASAGTDLRDGEGCLAFVWPEWGGGRLTSSVPTQRRVSAQTGTRLTQRALISRPLFWRTYGGPRSDPTTLAISRSSACSWAMYALASRSSSTSVPSAVGFGAEEWWRPGTEGWRSTQAFVRVSSSSSSSSSSAASASYSLELCFRCCVGGGGDGWGGEDERGGEGMWRRRDRGREAGDEWRLMIESNSSSTCRVVFPASVRDLQKGRRDRTSSAMRETESAGDGGRSCAVPVCGGNCLFALSLSVRSLSSATDPGLGLGLSSGPLSLSKRLSAPLPCARPTASSSLKLRSRRLCSVRALGLCSDAVMAVSRVESSGGISSSAGAGERRTERECVCSGAGGGERDAAGRGGVEVDGGGASSSSSSSRKAMSLSSDGSGARRDDVADADESDDAGRRLSGVSPRP